MPKTFNNIFDDIISLENLYEAHRQVQKGKKRNDVAANAKDHIEEIIDKMQQDLINMTWQPDPYRRFVTRKEVKRRKIDEPSYRDRILQHGIVKKVRPFFEPKFIFDSYAVTPGKGQHKAVFRVQDFIRRATKQGEVYVLQCDIHHYYESIHHDILFAEIQRTIRDKRLLEIWRRIIEGYSADGTPGIGIPIGAVTSQLSANIYLNTLDHFIKECASWKYYVRYMDDFLLIGNSKQELWAMLDDIKWFIDTQLRLKLNPKTRLFKAKQGVDFAGYRIFPQYLLPRKRNVVAARRRFKMLSHKFKRKLVNEIDVDRRVQAFLGYMSHCRGYQSTQSTLKYLKLTKEEDSNGKNSVNCDDLSKRG